MVQVTKINSTDAGWGDSVFRFVTQAPTKVTTCLSSLIQQDGVFKPKTYGVHTLATLWLSAFYDRIRDRSGAFVLGRILRTGAGNFSSAILGKWINCISPVHLVEVRYLQNGSQLTVPFLLLWTLVVADIKHQEGVHPNRVGKVPFSSKKTSRLLRGFRRVRWAIFSDRSRLLDAHSRLSISGDYCRCLYCSQ
jgi:hypothetical protein